MSDLYGRRYGQVSRHDVLGQTLANAQHGLGHHDRCIDDHAKIDGPQREQVGRHVQGAHQQEHRRERHRDGRRRDQGDPSGAQKGDQDQTDQDHPLKDGVTDIVDRRADQIVPVDIGHDLDALGRQILVELGDPRVEAFQDRRGVFVFQEIDNAFDRVRVGVLADHALADLVTDLHLAQIPHAHRHAVSGRHGGCAYVGQGEHPSDAPHHIGLFAPGHPPAAGDGGGCVDGVDHVIDGDAEAHELDRIELQLKFLGIASEIVDIGHALNLIEGRDDDPALDLRHLHQVLGFGFQRVAIDLARRAGNRVLAWGHPRRKRRLGDAFIDPLALPVVLCAVLEHQGDQGKAERRG